MTLRKILARQPFSPLGLAAIAGGLLFVVVAWFLFATWQHDRRAAAEARVGTALSQGRDRSAAEAGRIVDDAHAAATQSEALSRENADAIRNAPGAGQALDPGLNDAGRRGLCKRPSYRGSAECVQLLGPP